MRALHVLDHSLPVHSGYTFRTRALMKAQQTNGIEVRGITGFRHDAEGPDAEVVDGLMFHRTPGERAGISGIREWREIAALAASLDQLVQEWRPDVIHAHSPALCGIAAMKVADRHGLPLVYEIRAFWEDAAVGNGTGREGSVKYRLTRSLENRVVSGADAVVTICEGLRDDLVRRGVAPGKISIMPNGVDMDLFGKPLPRDNPLARDLELGAGPVIGFIGSFYGYEGLDDLIDAMELLVAAQPEARLMLVGGGPVADGLRRRADASPVSHAIRFVGRVPHSEVDRYYSICDVMAYPRKSSRLTDLVTPLKPLEAMAQGKLVAASAVGGHRELIEDGKTGMLFAPDDPASCARVLSALLARKDEWGEMRAAAKDHVASNHDWQLNARRYHDIYQTALDRGENRRVSAAA